MATLTISHYIYLSRKQRYDLHEGQTIDVIGISVPVWFQRGNTSEPAVEYFCKYKLKNEKEGGIIESSKEGYVINLPQKTKEEEELSKEEKEAISIKLNTSERLLDLEDGGSEWLEFRQYQKIRQGKKEFSVIHFVEIKPYEILETVS